MAGHSGLAASWGVPWQDIANDPTNLSRGYRPVEEFGWTRTQFDDYNKGKDVAEQRPIPPGVTESVTISAEAPLLDTSTVVAGRAITNREVMDLPVLGNNIVMLTRFAPGVQVPGTTQLLVQGQVGGGSGYYAPGNVGGNEWSLDGAAFQPGLPDWLTWTALPCTADGVWGSCTWTLQGQGTVPVSTGTYVIRTTVSDGTQSSSTDVTIVVTPEDLEEYLGPARFDYGELDAEDQVGMATGLVVSDAGGDIGGVPMDECGRCRVGAGRRSIAPTIDVVRTTWPLFATMLTSMAGNCLNGVNPISTVTRVPSGAMRGSPTPLMPWYRNGHIKKRFPRPTPLLSCASTPAASSTRRWWSVFAAMSKRIS